jgi:hypothetical protein
MTSLHGILKGKKQVNDALAWCPASDPPAGSRPLQKAPNYRAHSTELWYAGFFHSKSFPVCLHQ